MLWIDGINAFANIKDDKIQMVEKQIADYQRTETICHKCRQDFVSCLVLDVVQHHGASSRLTADVDDVVSVRETIEAGSRALGVGTHVLKVEPVANVDGLVEANTLRDAVDAITGGTPDRVFDTLRRRFRGISVSGVIEKVARRAQNLGDGMLVVKHDAAEVSVQAIVDVDHVARGGRKSAVHAAVRVLDSAASNDVAGDGEGSRDEVTTGLGDQGNAAVRREVLVKSITKDAGHGLEGLVATESTTDVKGLHVKAMCSSLLKHIVGIANSLQEGKGIGCARANVERDTDNIKAKLTG